jgi:hypothetical protein
MLSGGNSEAVMHNHVKMLTFLSIFFYFSPAFCQSDIPAALKQLLKDRIDAISSKDTSTLNKICTKNYQIINSAGVKMTLPELKTSVIKTETPVKLSTILSYQPFIAEDETMAFATFELEEEIVKDRQNIIKNDLIITEIYKKEKNKWKTQLTHTSQKICMIPASGADSQPKSLNNAVEEPKTVYGIAAQPKPASHDTTTMNIPNSKGGFTPVRLAKHNNGYIGPQGEFYNGFPTVNQLEVLYGD